MSAPPIFGLGTRMQIQGNTVLWRVCCVMELLNIELRKFLEGLVMLTH